MTVADRRSVVAMLTRVSGECGFSLADFYRLGHADALDDPRLRDLWLIWGDVLRADDLVVARDQPQVVRFTP